MKAALATLALLCGCGDDTRVVVYVKNGGLTVPRDLDAVHVKVGNRASGAWWKDGPTVPLCPASGSCKNFPLTLGVFPGDPKFSGAVLVQVDALLGSDVVQSDAATFNFVDGRRESVEFVLRPICQNSFCSTTERACNEAGQCRPLGFTGFGGGGADLASPTVDAGADLASSPRDLAGADLTPVTWTPRSSMATSSFYGLHGVTGFFAAACAFSVYSSTNGRDWLGEMPPGANILNDVWVVSPTEMYALNGDVVMHKTGGGWIDEPTNQAQSRTLLDLFAAGGNLFAVGHAGTVVVRPLAGGMWTQRPMPSANPYSLYGVWASASELFVVGDAGFAARSRDRGQSWPMTPLRTNTPRDLFAVFGASDAEIYAVGLADTVLHSLDHGDTWLIRPSSANTTEAFYDVWASGPNNVFIVGTNGRIQHSIDGGQTWQSEVSNTLEDLNTVWGLPTGEVFAVGANGIILQRN